MIGPRCPPRTPAGRSRRSRSALPDARRLGHARQHLRPDRPRLHDGVRDPQAPQLRPRRRVHDRRRTSASACSTSSAAPRTRAISIWLVILLMMLAAMVGCAVVGVTIERFAYRPLRTAPRIAPLISALGVSFFLQYSVQLLFGAAAQDLRHVPDGRRPPLRVGHRRGGRSTCRCCGSSSSSAPRC